MKISLHEGWEFWNTFDRVVVELKEKFVDELFYIFSLIRFYFKEFTFLFVVKVILVVAVCIVSWYLYRENKKLGKQLDEVERKMIKEEKEKYG